MLGEQCVGLRLGLADDSSAPVRRPSNSGCVTCSLPVTFSSCLNIRDSGSGSGRLPPPTLLRLNHQIHAQPSLPQHVRCTPHRAMHADHAAQLWPHTRAAAPQLQTTGAMMHRLAAAARRYCTNGCEAGAPSSTANTHQKQAAKPRRASRKGVRTLHCVGRHTHTGMHAQDIKAGGMRPGVACAHLSWFPSSNVG